MIQKSFKAKIIIPVIVVIVALVVTLNVFLSIRFSAMSDNLVNEKLIANANSLRFFLEDSKANTREAAVSMAVNPDAIKAISERNSNEIARLFGFMESLYRIDHFTVCDDEGTVLARTFDPDTYGDSGMDQQSVLDALNGKISTYYETAALINVAVRTGCPVFDEDGELIGVVLAGVRLDTENAVEDLKKIFISDVTMFLGDTRIASTMTRNGESIIGTKLDPRIAEIVIKNRQEYSGEVDILGEKYAAFYMPLLDANEEAFATFFLGIPVAELTAALSSSIRAGMILGLCGLIVSIVVLFIILSSISEPIVKLSKDMNHIADGNLGIEIHVKGEDEVAELGKSIQKATDVIHKLLEDIDFMINEHEKGNTDYFLNSGEFRGDYRVLADSVLLLVSLGMRDPLTGIPNKRSFENRLPLEWYRAAREKAPLSLLVIDMDEFKNYDYRFGDEQGDKTLQMVAKTIKGTLKRLIDFVARWGGEKFMVLLPMTDSAGALIVAEKVRKIIESLEIPCADPNGAKVTVSIGVNTQIPLPDSPVDNFVSAAEDALLKAKEAGKNRVMYGGESDG